MFPIARAELSLARTRGNRARCARLCSEFPKDFDPGGAVTTIAVRLALMERDFDEADRRLGTCTECKYNDVGLCGLVGALDDYTVPRDWYVGLIARGRGQEEGGRTRLCRRQELQCWRKRKIRLTTPRS